MSKKNKKKIQQKMYSFKFSSKKTKKIKTTYNDNGINKI